MLLEREYVPDPGRIIYSRETGFAPDAPADVLARPLVIECEPEPPKVEVVSRYRRMEPLRRERPAVIPRDVPEKRTLRPQPKRGPSPFRLEHVTVESITALQAEGKTIAEVATALQCSVNVVYVRLRAVRPRVPFEAKAGYVFPGSQLTIIRELAVASRSRQILCRCDCGRRVAVALSSATCGNWKSCGCLKRKLMPDVAAEVRKKRKAGASVKDLCAEFGFSRETLRRAWGKRKESFNTPAITVDICT